MHKRAGVLCKPNDAIIAFLLDLVIEFCVFAGNCQLKLASSSRRDVLFLNLSLIAAQMALETTFKGAKCRVLGWST